MVVHCSRTLTKIHLSRLVLNRLIRRREFSKDNLHEEHPLFEHQPLFKDQPPKNNSTQSDWVSQRTGYSTNAIEPSCVQLTTELVELLAIFRAFSKSIIIVQSADIASS